ncbi:MAG TPA: histidine phosphatase family protein [Abditibacterium sp.]|jgi:broad specificity phosphatase PhoE
MTTIYLVRHGEVAGNSGAVRTFAGMSDLQLTPRGLEQARAVAARFESTKIDAVYASTLQRAYLTADGIAARHGLSATRDAGWCEVDYGAWEGLSEADILADYADLWRARVADPWSVPPPGGESYQALWARLEPAWNRVLEAHRGQTVVVVGHNGSLRVLLCQLLGAPPANARRLQIGNCSVTRIDIGDAPGESKTVAGGKLEGPPLVIEYINNSAHLEGI